MTLVRSAVAFGSLLAMLQACSAQSVTEATPYTVPTDSSDAGARSDVDAQQDSAPPDDVGDTSTAVEAARADTESPVVDSGGPVDSASVVDTGPATMPLTTTFPKGDDPQHPSGDWYGERVAPSLPSASRMTGALKVYCGIGCAPKVSIWIGGTAVVTGAVVTDAMCSHSGGTFTFDRTFASVSGTPVPGGWKYAIDSSVYDCAGSTLLFNSGTVTIQ